MNITIPAAHVNATSPLTIKMGDNGNAFVSISLDINGFDRFKHSATWSGDLRRVLAIPPGTYLCTVVIAAFKEGALGSSYDSEIFFNGNVVASASGVITTGASDIGFISFNLTIVP